METLNNIPTLGSESSETVLAARRVYERPAIVVICVAHRYSLLTASDGSSYQGDHEGVNGDGGGHGGAGDGFGGGLGHGGAGFGGDIGDGDSPGKPWDFDDDLTHYNSYKVL